MVMLYFAVDKAVSLVAGSTHVHGLYIPHVCIVLRFTNRMGYIPLVPPPISNNCIQQSPNEPLHVFPPVSSEEYPSWGLLLQTCMCKQIQST